MVAKQPTIVRKTPPQQSRRPSFKLENIARVRAHLIPRLNRYYAFPKGPIQARPLLQTNAITSLNSFDSGYSRNPVQWNRSLGRHNHHGYQQRRPLVSNSIRASRRWPKKGGGPSIDVSSLYSGDRDIELAYVDERYSAPDTFPLYLAQGELDDDLHNPSPAIGREIRRRRSIWNGFKFDRKGLRTIFCLTITVGGGHLPDHCDSGREVHAGSEEKSTKCG